MTITIGVIGGGQLARMMIPPAVELGLRLRVLAETEGASAALAADAVGDYRDAGTVLAFAREVDVITFDHEHVPQPVLAALVDAGVAVHPGPEALAVAQDKLIMRSRLSALGVPVPRWAAVTGEAELAAFLDAHGGKAVVKTPRGGYDGKGVRVVEEPAQVAEWFASAQEDGNPGVLLAEEFVPFRRELAQLVARRPSGQLVAWPLVQTVQAGGVCAEVYAPAPGADPGLGERAEQIARTIAEGLGVTGVLAVELFETEDGGLLVNELAMRPHNSGHWTIEGSVTSQFEQHLRAVADLPLGATEARAPSVVMVNVLGGPAEGTIEDLYPEVLGLYPAAKVHSYGKAPRPGRKLGHVTACAERFDSALSIARGAASALLG